MKLYEIRVTVDESEFTFTISAMNVFAAVTRFRMENWQRPWFENLTNLGVTEAKERKGIGNG